MDIAEHITATIKSALPARAEYALHEPYFNNKEVEYVADCVKSGWVSSVGQYVNRFEDKLAAYTGAKKAIAVVNGTAALHICLLLANIEPGDEVLCPTITFVATANAIKYCGATPHFVDCESQTLGVDPEKLREYLRNNMNRKIKALVVTHIFGHPAKLQELKRVADEFGIILIEDMAEGLGSFYHNQHVGNYGHLSALSFNGNKIITTGGGGAVITNDEQLAAKAKYITTTAKKPHPYEYYHDQLGYNYRMPNLNAALGCAQLEKLDEFLAVKRKLFANYQAAFKNSEIAEVMAEPDHCQSNYWLQAIILKPEYIKHRDEILQKTNAEKVMTRPIWQPMHHLPYLSSCPKMDLSCAENMFARVINIPSSANLAGEFV